MSNSTRKFRRGGRPQRTSAAQTESEAAKFDVMAECVTRWQTLPAGERYEESCPFCRALVLVTNRASEFDASHAMPACDPWTMCLLALGANRPRVEHHQR